MAYNWEKPGTNCCLSCTQHAKQNKQINKNFKWAIQFLAITNLHLKGCKTNKWWKRNGPYQFKKGIWHHKLQNLFEKKCLLVDFQPTQSLGVQVSIKSNTTIYRVFLGESPQYPKICQKLWSILESLLFLLSVYPSTYLSIYLSIYISLSIHILYIYIY